MPNPEASIKTLKHIDKTNSEEDTMGEPAHGLYTCIPSQKNLQTGIWTPTDEMLVVEAASLPDAIRRFEAWKKRHNLPYTFPHIQYHVPTEDAYAVDITKPEDPDGR